MIATANRIRWRSIWKHMAVAARPLIGRMCDAKQTHRAPRTNINVINDGKWAHNEASKFNWRQQSSKNIENKRRIEIYRLQWTECDEQSEKAQQQNQIACSAEVSTRRRNGDVVKIFNRYEKLRQTRKAKRRTCNLTATPSIDVRGQHSVSQSDSIFH